MDPSTHAAAFICLQLGDWRRTPPSCLGGSPCLLPNSCPFQGYE